MQARVIEILYWYNGPQMISLKDNQDNNLIAFAVDDASNDKDESNAIWMVSAISDTDMQALNNDKLTLRDAMTTNRAGPALTGVFGGGVGEAVELTELGREFNDDELPEAGYYLELVERKDDSGPQESQNLSI